MVLEACVTSLFFAPQLTNSGVNVRNLVLVEESRRSRWPGSSRTQTRKRGGRGVATPRATLRPTRTGTLTVCCVVEGPKGWCGGDDVDVDLWEGEVVRGER